MSPSKTGKYEPCHPGVVLKEELSNAGITQEEAAQAIGINRKNLSFILNGHYSITSEMAVRLSIALGTTAQFWLNLQNRWSLSQVDTRSLKVMKLRKQKR